MRRIGAVLWFASGLAAQATPLKNVADIVQDLRSDEAAKVAWAADAARAAEGKELDRALLTALTVWAKRTGEHTELVRVFLLDAMITHKTRVPGDLLEPMLDEPACSNAALVLLCQSPRQNELLLLRRFRAHAARDLQRLALGNVLAANRTPGFAAQVWDNDQIRPILLVAGASSGRESLRVERSLAMESEGDIAGFPPIPHFVLCDRTGDDAVLLAPGLSPVTYRRTVGDDETRPFYPSSRVPFAMELDWLETMAGKPDSVMTDACIAFTTPAAYVQTATAARDRLLGQRRALLRGLVATGAMTAAEAATCNVTDVVIRDGRTDAKTALPTLPPPAKTSGQLMEELAGDDARMVAWAADAARTNPDLALDRALRKALLAWATRGSEGAAAARLFLLDALIVRGADVPGDLLAPMLDDPTTRDAAFVLVCRAPKANERLLLARYAVHRGPAGQPGNDDEEWRLAIGNLLAAQGAPGFAALLWNAPEARPRIEVGSLHPAGFDLVGLGFGNSRAIRVPEGFPPVPIHEARCGPCAAAETTIQGPIPIAFVRSTDPTMASQIRLPLVADPCTELRWLETLAGLPPGDAMHTQVPYTTEAAWLIDAAAARDRLLARRRELRAALCRRGAFTADDLTRCTIGEVEVLDARPDTTKPLPTLPPPGR